MSIFREYDIRGVAETELTDQFVWSIGHALGDMIKEAGDSNCYIGQDVRLSSPRLAIALANGLRASNVSVKVLEPGPTPLLYFAASLNSEDFPTTSGIMITGSHNPAEYNGFKIVIAGKTLFGNDIQEIQNKCGRHLPDVPSGFEPIGEQVDLTNEYVEYLKSTLRLNSKKMPKVVLDAGNGAAGPLAIKTFKALGCEVIDIFCDPDGRFPNHHPDPTVHKNLEDLIKKVKETNADMGIGFDGDGDRIGAVTTDGQIMSGDHLVLYYARDILKDAPGATIISEVKSSQVLYDELAKMGANPIVWKTGHSLIKAKLKETNAELAGEMSGHMFFANRYKGYDDAIYAGARLVESFCLNEPERLDEFMNSLPQVFNTPEIRVECEDSKKFEIVQEFVKKAKEEKGNDVLDIDGARIKFSGGWGLLRASNTQPVLVTRFEGKDKETMQEIKSYFETLLNKIDPDIKIPKL